MASPKPKPVARAAKSSRARPALKIKVARNLLNRGTLRCIYYPNRTRARIFTPKKVGAIVCQMLSLNASVGKAVGLAPRPEDVLGEVELRKQLRLELERCFPCEDAPTQRSLTQAAAQIAVQASELVADNARVLAVAIAVLAALVFLPRLVPQLPRFLLVLVPVAARATVTQLPAALARLRGQQAANDAFFRAVSGLR